MESTKNDLSLNRAKLDFEAMKTTARLAYSYIQNKMTETLGGLGRHGQSYTAQHLDANRLKRMAEELAVAVETYCTLAEATVRQHLEVVNKPKIENNLWEDDDYDDEP